MPLASGAILELPADVRSARAKLLEFLAAADWSGDLDTTLIAVQEALINAERHGEGLRHVAARLRNGYLEVQVADRGSPFDPAPYTAREPDLFAERGRGWWLITQIASDFEITVEPQGCRVTLTFAPTPPTTPDQPPAAAPSLPGLADLGVEVLSALGAVAIITDAHLMVREAAGATLDLLDLAPEDIEGRDFRGYVSEVKHRFADPGLFEDHALASYTLPDGADDAVFVLVDGRSVRRHSMAIVDDGASLGRLAIYVPVGGSAARPTG